MMKKVLFVMIVVFAVSGCGTKPNAGDLNTGDLNAGDSNDKDTVQVVTPDLIRLDSMTFNKEVLLDSPFSAETLLSLAKVHSFEDWLYNYGNTDGGPDDLEAVDSDYEAHRDSCAFELANRLMRMNEVVTEKGDAMDMLQWAVAVNVTIDTFCVKVPEVPHDSALNEIGRIMDKYTSWSQIEMNAMSDVYATIEYYYVIEAYRQWLDDLPQNLKALGREEYEAWYQLNEARFAFWRDVSYIQNWYSMKIMEIDNYYSCLAKSRLAELADERKIILGGKNYQQQGKTVTTKQWEDWLKEKSVPEDADENPELVPDAAVVEKKREDLRQAFSRWLAARQAMVKALPSNQGKSYDKLTADMHGRLVEMLEWPEPFNGQ